MCIRKKCDFCNIDVARREYTFGVTRTYSGQRWSSRFWWWWGRTRPTCSCLYISAFQPDILEIWVPRPQKRQNHFCNLSGRIEISSKCRKGGNFPILTAKIFSKLKPQVLFSISKRKWLCLVIARFKCLEHFNETFPPSWNRSYFFYCYFEVYHLCVLRFQNSERKNSYI